MNTTHEQAVRVPLISTGEHGDYDTTIDILGTWSGEELSILINSTSRTSGKRIYTDVPLNDMSRLALVLSGISHDGRDIDTGAQADVINRAVSYGNYIKTSI